MLDLPEGGVTPRVEEPFTERLAIARQLIAAGPRAVTVPSHLHDQVEAAARECHQAVEQAGVIAALLEPDRRWRQSTRRGRDDQRAHLLAAVLDTMRNVCVHLRREGPQPAYAQLPLRRLDCRRCVVTRRVPPPDDDDRCDVCGARGIDFFTPFVVASGALLISGDACLTCAAALEIQEVAA